MGYKPQDERTYKRRVTAGQGGMSTEQIRQAKNSRSHSRRETRREILREEAGIRAAGWNSHTLDEKLSIIAGRRGKSQREVSRLSRKVTA